MPLAGVCCCLYEEEIDGFPFVLAAGAVAAALVSLPTVAQVPPSLEQKVQNLQSDLTVKGYEVARGQWHLFTIDDCRFAIASMGFCMGNNPAAPYVIPTVPHWDLRIFRRTL